ncbi:hypothetical protein WJ0W_007129 [Paenibacillus melissococcoides]|uniref:Uncharacterized protein n=1 Tax=Paenibacillus melissococcoides TaxID=2912268 RepID=A0ABM9G9T5_9BACL|nr:hypothetical protein [Paenibacillus melissococcoides]CAH8248461.1 hypothetical protein WJ0W_007129 [Paenibacillus melissococcoides]CAH8722037.1 hypothetical protein HTL2_006661 [Paenibacillus melissococcoides]CAH8722147.1 hypothetical protein WDD9_006650 [Paenibacillus melissococcoides]
MRETVWTGDLTLNEVVILQMSLDESIESFQRTIKEISESQAMNLTNEKKKELIARYEDRVAAYSMLKERFDQVSY